MSQKAHLLFCLPLSEGWWVDGKGRSFGSQRQVDFCNLWRLGLESNVSMGCGGWYIFVVWKLLFQKTFFCTKISYCLLFWGYMGCFLLPFVFYLNSGAVTVMFFWNKTSSDHVFLMHVPPLLCQFWCLPCHSHLPAYQHLTTPEAELWNMPHHVRDKDWHAHFIWSDI